MRNVRKKVVKAICFMLVIILVHGAIVLFADVGANDDVLGDYVTDNQITGYDCPTLGQPVFDYNALLGNEPTQISYEFDVLEQEHDSVRGTQYAVTRFFDGGSIVLRNIYLRPPGSIILHLDTLERPGYRFGGWREAPGVIWAAGAPAVWRTASTGNWDLHAHWIRNTQAVATVRFSSTGHTGDRPADIPFAAPGTLFLPGPGNMTRAGHKFVGWEDHRGDIWPAGARAIWTTASTGDWHLAAHWVPFGINYTMSYRIFVNPGVNQSANIAAANQIMDRVDPHFRNMFGIDLRRLSTDPVSALEPRSDTGIACFRPGRGGWCDFRCGRYSNGGDCRYWHHRSLDYIIREVLRSHGPVVG